MQPATCRSSRSSWRHTSSPQSQGPPGNLCTWLSLAGDPRLPSAVGYEIITSPSLLKGGNQFPHPEPRRRAEVHRGWSLQMAGSHLLAPAGRHQPGRGLFHSTVQPGAEQGPGRQLARLHDLIGAPERVGHPASEGT